MIAVDIDGFPQDLELTGLVISDSGINEKRFPEKTKDYRNYLLHLSSRSL